MPHFVTLDVIDASTRYVIRTLRRGEELRRRGSALALIGAPTYNFSTGWLPHYTLGRVAILTAWAGLEEARAGWAASIAPWISGQDGWHLLGEVARVRATTPWLNWTPDDAGAAPLAGDDPALVIIQGRLRSRHLHSFMSAARRVVAQAERAPGYLAGIGVQATWDETTSVSCWRTMRDARRFAFTTGAHAQAVAADRKAPWHHTECFLQIRPIASHGTLGGVQPFAGLLANQATTFAGRSPT